MSDAQRSRPIRRDPRRSGGGYNRPFRREGPPGPAGPGVDYRALVEYVAKTLAEKPDELGLARATGHEQGVRRVDLHKSNQ